MGITPLWSFEIFNFILPAVDCACDKSILDYFQIFCAPVAQLDRVPGYGPGGWGFDSLRVCHSKIFLILLTDFTYKVISFLQLMSYLIKSNLAKAILKQIILARRLLDAKDIHRL